jgi:hypothetical protein
MEEKSKLISMHDVPFAGDIVQTLGLGDDVYVVMKPLCEKIGMDWRSQLKHIRRDPLLGQLVATMKAQGEDGKSHDMIVLPFYTVCAWLAHLHITRHKEGVRAKLLAYQRYAVEVLGSKAQKAEGGAS